MYSSYASFLLNLLVFSDKSCLTFCDPGTAAHQTVSLQFPRQEYWSGLPFPSQGYLPDPGIELESLAWQLGSFALSHLRSPFSGYLLLFVVAIVAFARLFHIPEKK